jgi:hypothetical protein
MDKDHFLLKDRIAQIQNINPLSVILYVCKRNKGANMYNNQIKLLTTLAKKIRSEQKDRDKVKDRDKIIITFKSARILNAKGNLTAHYSNLEKALSTSK